MLDTWANLCVSESESLELLGRDAHEVNNLVCKLSSFLLNRGFRLIFGHDWREDGVMRAVAVLAEKSTEEFRHLTAGDLPRMLNLVPRSLSELHESSIRAAEESGGVLEVFSLVDMSQGASTRRGNAWARALISDSVLRRMDRTAMAEDPVYQNWMLRHALTAIGQGGIRICLGGKTAGYSGYYAGIAEEAYFALASDMPLYLIGGFGGATGAIAQCFAERPGSLYVNIGDDKPLLPNSQVQPGEAAMTFAKRSDFPLDSLEDWLKAQDMSRLCRANGLKPDENEKLFRTTDIEVALHLMERGLQRLKRRRSRH